jgi:RimJ/RimL family protein N-acetyltransferase
MYADPEVTRFLGGPIDRNDRADGVLLGRAGLWRPEGWPGVEVGWMFARSAWGQGFATESAHAAVQWAWEKVDTPRLISLIHPDNAASMRVARRVGMAPVGEHVLGEQRAIVFGVERPQVRLKSPQPG